MSAGRFLELAEPQRKGQATEAIIKTAFVLRDYPVLEPAYDNEPYDFVIECGGGFIRFQAKTAHETDSGTIQFETVSTKARSDGYVRDDYTGQIDYFAIYSPSLEDVFLVHIDDAARGKMELRFEEPENNQWTGINWYEDYQMDSVLEDEIMNKSKPTGEGNAQGPTDRREG